MADAHDNPKTIKMFETEDLGGGKPIHVRAVTYLRTALIGWQKKFYVSDEVKKAEDTLKDHGHFKGIVLEVGKLE